MTMTVGMLMGDDDHDCVFMQGSGDNWRAVAPPSPALESLCKLYGDDYRLKPPDPTPGAAQARRQEQ